MGCIARNAQIQCCLNLHGVAYLQAATLRQRYVEEMQPYVIWRQSWHDQTLKMWIEAFFDPGN